MYSTIGVDRNRLNSNGRSILYRPLAGCPNSAAAARSPSLRPHSGSSPPPPPRGPRPCAHARDHLRRFFFVAVLEDGERGGELEEEQRRRAGRRSGGGAHWWRITCAQALGSAITAMAPSTSRPPAQNFGASCSGRNESSGGSAPAAQGGLSSGVRSASSPCMRTREGSDSSKAGGKRGGRTMACSPTGRRRCSKNPSSAGTWSSSSSDVGASGSEDAAMAVGAGEDQLG
jgi:hypothetical protein